MTAINIRQLTSEGLATFRSILDEVTLTGKVPTAKVAALLEHPDQTIILEGATIEVAAHATRKALGLALVTALETVDSEIQMTSDIGLWSWLGLAHLEALVHRENGRAVPRDNFRWILDNRHTRYYKHYVWGAWAAVNAHQDDLDKVEVILHQHPSRPGDLVETLAGRLEFLTSPAIMGAATRLYSDATGKAKPGSSSQTAPGRPRRFVQVVQTLDVTWQLRAMTVDEIIDLLPDEFNTWIAA